MTIDPCCLFKEADPDGKYGLPQSLEEDVEIDGSRVLMELYLPGGIFEGPHPVVILCHGIPGTNNNDDLAQALRRMGCAVLRPYHRGAWGSDGVYSFSHCIEDAVFLAHWARKRENAEAFSLDPDNIFLAGHSNGGNTVINASRQLPFLKGTIAFCPYDHFAGTRCFSKEALSATFQDCASVLHLTSFADLWQDGWTHAEEWSFIKAAPWFQNRNLLLMGGSNDTIAPPRFMVDPLWSALAVLPTKAHHKKAIFPSNHALDNARLALTQTMGEWIAEVVNDKK